MCVFCGWAFFKIYLCQEGHHETHSQNSEGKNELRYPTNYFSMCIYKGSLVAHMVKNLPAMQETQVWSLGEEDPLEKGMATHSSILAWRTPWTEEPGRLQIHGVAKSRTWVSNVHFTSLYIYKDLKLVHSNIGIYLNVLHSMNYFLNDIISSVSGYASLIACST